MAYKDRLKISIQNAAGDYYTATLQNDNTYTVTTGAGVAYLKHLPIGWEKTSLEFDRNLTYKGVFRSQTESMDFVADGRAILLSLMYGGGGVQAYALITVYKLNEATHAYDVFYQAEADLSAAVDSKQKKIYTVPLLEGRAVEMLKAKSTSNFNIPYWKYSGGAWNVDGATFIYHDGIKLLWSCNWISAATAANPIGATIGGALYAWNRGSVSDGRHWIPTINQYNIVQNNGTSTYIGNDILQPVFPIYDQQFNYNRNFEGNDDIQAYTKNRGALKNLLGYDIDMLISVSGQIESTISYNNAIAQDQYIRIVLFQIGVDDLPEMSGGNYQYDTIHTISIPSGGDPYTPPDSGVFSGSATITLLKDKMYCVGIIYDGVTSGISGNSCTFKLIDFEVNIASIYNSGTSSPVNAPILPPSVFPAFSPYNLWQRLVQSIDSVTTDVYGFPVIVGDFTGTSTYLNTTNDPEDDYGLAVQLLMFSSENAVRDIRGIQYLTISVADFFKTLFNIDGCGLGIEGSNIRIEKLAYFFDAATEILSLGNTVEGLTIEPMSTDMFNNIKGGYKEPSTNNNFGVDEFNIPVEYNLPLTKTPKTQDLSVSAVVAGQYEIEKMRAQRSEREVSAPSASNSVVLLQLTADAGPTSGIVKPDGSATTTGTYYLLKFPTAQSTDPTAASDPYINGMYYPDTAINVGLQPARNLLRLGSYLRSICDQQDAAYMSFRKQYQMNYANPVDPLELPGINTNVLGSAINATSDILIGDLDDQLFRPYLLKFTATYPESMWQLINSNPYGYISFEWEGSTYKGFIYKVRQQAGNSEPTEFELIAHPDMTDAQLKK